ncbi:Predicted ester cyclase [Sphingomonas gellani]|uniref:Predicted ester cyclase n=1 Tax=Sphingomonas gellani TaxID=1166340 RepID=A0A1H8GUA5_9SPHN|nr:ester cyclase [Sphingomonas gellani]SEN47536.1 Predicted ester cyclase [Sphingomonas gellani]
MRLIPALALLVAATPALSAQVDDRAAIAIARPRAQIVDRSLSPATVAALLKPVEAFYGFWNNASQTLLDQAIAPGFIDHALPPGRPQGPKGPMVAARAFLGAVPDLRVAVTQRLVVGDRVVSALHFTGHFTGTFQGRKGAGQPIDFIATDILAVRSGRITDNWHLEDNLTFMKQIDAAK